MQKYYKETWMTQKFLKETFNYCDTGNFIWKEDRPFEHFATTVGYKVYKAQRAGKIAGKIAINGKRDNREVVVSYKGDKVKYPLHKLIFLYHRGFVPELIDHVDGNYLNNRISNLQELNFQLNTAKATMFSHNTTGYRGVRYRKRDDKYIVNIKVDSVGYYCGQYSCVHKAALVYNYIANAVFGEYHYKNDVPHGICLDYSDLSGKFFTTHLPTIKEYMDKRYGTERKYKRR